MSEETATESGHKKRPTDRDKSQVEPSVKDQQLFEWLEQLFYAEPEVAHFPERIDIHLMSGKYSQKFEACIDKLTFAPKKAASKKASDEAGVEHAGNGKPTREKLVWISNKMLHDMQSDCDSNGRPQVYGIHAWHFSRGDEPYARLLRSYKPRGRHKVDGVGEDDDDMPMEKRFGIQILGHQQQMVGMLGAGYEGMMDRYDRAHERDAAEIDRLRNENQKLREQLERALSTEIDREERRQWITLKNKATDRALGWVDTFGTPLIGKLIGGKTEASAEAATLKNFLRTTEEGGQLTTQQAIATFGDWDNENNILRSPGILTRAQGEIIFRVAMGQSPADDLDRLLPNAGECGITTEQFMQLQQIYSMEQIGPLLIIFKSRQQKE